MDAACAPLRWCLSSATAGQRRPQPVLLARIVSRLAATTHRIRAGAAKPASAFDPPPLSGPGPRRFRSRPGLRYGMTLDGAVLATCFILICSVLHDSSCMVRARPSVACAFRRSICRRYARPAVRRSPGRQRRRVAGSARRGRPRHAYRDRRSTRSCPRSPSARRPSRHPPSLPNTESAMTPAVVTPLSNDH